MKAAIVKDRYVIEISRTDIQEWKNYIIKYMDKNIIDQYFSECQQEWDSGREEGLEHNELFFYILFSPWATKVKKWKLWDDMANDDKIDFVYKNEWRDKAIEEICKKTGFKLGV